MADAVRPRNCWFFVITELVGKYEFSLGYKYADGSVSFFSAAGRTASLKTPWDPPVSCEFRVVMKKGEESQYFRFVSPKGDNQNLKVKILNNLFAGGNDFTRRCTAMVIDKKYELLAMYISLLVKSRGFTHHREDLHGDTGVRLDGKGLDEDALKDKGGSIEEMLEFKSFAEKAAFGVSQSKLDAIDKIVEMSGTGSKRKDQPESDGGPKAKVNKLEARLDAKRKEIKDEEGVEKAFVDSFVGRADVKIENISISKTLCFKLNPFKVDGIAREMKSRFDPSKIHLTVAPAEPEKFDPKRLAENKYVVVAGNHSLAALKQLDKTGHMRNLVSMGEGLVNCYIVNTKNPAVICYGTLRSNDLDAKFAREPTVHDLLFVFNTLKAALNLEEAIKVVMRYAALLAIGPDEVTALKKICSWEPDTFANLLNVVQIFEKYETIDSKNHGNQARLLRGEPMPLSKVLFKRLAKVDTHYFDENVQSILDKQLALKDLVTNFETLKEHDRLVEIILQLTGYQSIAELRILFPGPGNFEMEDILEYRGATTGPKGNTKGEKLENHCKSVLSQQSTGKQSVISFEVIEDSKVSVTMNDFTLVVVNMKTDDMNEVMEVFACILKSEGKDKLKSVLILFGSEIGQSSALSYIRNQKLPGGCLVSQILFDSVSSRKVDGKVHENLKFGILISKTEIVAPPLAIYNQDLSNLKNVVSKICPPGGSVAYVSEGDLPLIRIHNIENSSRNVTYFADDKTIKSFKASLAKERFSEVDESEEEIQNSSNEAMAVTPRRFDEECKSQDGPPSDNNTTENFSESEEDASGSDFENKEDVYNFNSEAEFDKKINATIQGYGQLIQDMDKMADDIKKDNADGTVDEEKGIVDDKDCLSRSSSTSAVKY